MTPEQQKALEALRALAVPDECSIALLKLIPANSSAADMIKFILEMRTLAGSAELERIEAQRQQTEAIRLGSQRQLQAQEEVTKKQVKAADTASFRLAVALLFGHR